MYTEKYFEERLTADGRRDIVWEELNRFFSAYYPKQLDKVVELGAGYCCWINNVKANKKVAIDISPIVRDYAKNGTEALVQDATELSSFEDNSVDMFLASNFFEHFIIEDVEKIILQINRVLKKGGRLCILQPNFRYCWREYFDDYTHRTIFTHEGLSTLLKENNFDLIKVLPKITPYSFKSSSIPTPRLVIRAYLNSPIRPGAKQMALIVEKK
ncbi:MAG: hypothetical protein A2725_01150 [Candidatus Magasanikbacteria bacterium RIFCSPHIGHO2_01_FULL_33_34]|uniref:Methyltransferase type 11 domain-containing protein n=1 Tax=Candidatus Magasanikbacteria bacterium RIFCSPHIGHO2_01_FULL_33_34 TaxID=1798671 RepID=A0A1F6LJ42_9BACT|nr:MAG: hypothetical protein A2725_01150 [Candidatus Magasanikbacteria bacterium RIFCSPHIGHO2_01_FULL_33_34]OGH65362.1 MAG: hypothetical protein A3B83_04810 [Candidatus Magasanikbacteria bacterium RIFCSPHIGHO2_02_FULL_33_17]OGH76138.1 MAG: hypothetical protein A3A89_01730 [Candidatus Magasanikbacteria bacterium RIFCSPLOWO2_01_FULL_33_34]